MKGKWILIAVGILALTSIFLLRLLELNSLPDDAFGVWKTSEPRYKDRFFELTRAAVTFGIGDGDTNSFSITGIDKSVEDHKTLYTIKYRDENGVDYRISFYYSPKNKGIIQFKNQKNIRWTKTKQ